MAKKKSTKKHQFKYAAPTTGVATAAPAAVETAASPFATPSLKSKPAAQATNGRSFAYVTHDLQRISVFASILVAAELLLWWVFAHTSVGNTVYAWFKI
ncbi:hypothetical protein HJC99_02335 [Candidatus Saccharibacteria bacterium]|nr:hypothetical protein [Candidatus Saccharibacteria bacterium]